MNVPIEQPRFARPLLVAVVTALVLPLAGLPAVAHADEIVVGELVRTRSQGDPAGPVEQATDGSASWVRTEAGETVRVAPDDVADVPVGSTVEVVLGADAPDEAAAPHGLEPARTALDVTVLEAAAGGQPTAAAPGPVTNEVLVVSVLAGGATPDPSNTTQTYVDVVNGWVHDFWADESDGAIELNATGWPSTVTTAAPCSSPYDMWDEAAAAVGFVPGPGKHLLLHVSSWGIGSWPCDYSMAELGWGPDAGGFAYVRGPGNKLIAHELGHNFGLDDSLNEQCYPSVESGDCRWGAGGDWYDVMTHGSPSYEPGSLSVAQSAALGVLPTDAVQTIGSAGTGDRTYQLAPVSGRTGVRALKMVLGSAVYWLEYRPPAGRDAWLPASNPPVQSGVLLRRVTFGSGVVELLDATPTSDPNDRSVAFPVGTPVTVFSGLYQVTVEAASSSGVTVRVNGYYLTRTPGDAACARRYAVSWSGVALLPTDDGLSAVVTGLDRGLWLRPLDGGPWQSLGGGVLYGPAATRAGSTSYVFVVGLDGSLFYRTDDGSGWGPWQNLGGYLTSSPAAASLGDGHVRVFGRGLDGQLFSRELTGTSWSGWVGHGGVITAPPSATAVPDADRIEATVRGTDGSSFTQALGRGVATAPYVRRDIVACSALIQPSVRTSNDPAIGGFVAANGRPDLLVSASTWAFGGVTTSTPALEYSGGGFVMAVRGLDNALWVYDGQVGGSGWVSLGGYIL